jgi:hypothetical protein
MVTSTPAVNPRRRIIGDDGDVAGDPHDVEHEGL